MAAASASTPAPTTELQGKDLALFLIRSRIDNDKKMGPADLPTMECVQSLSMGDGSTVYFCSLEALPGDRYGYGNAAARPNVAGGGYGWGNKAVVANLNVQRAYVTTMGFHRYYFDLGHGRVLGAPISDEYGHDGGSKQDFEKGSTFWAQGRGCWHTLNV